VAGKTSCGCYSCAVVAAIHARLWLIEPWDVVIVKREILHWLQWEC